MNHHGFAIKPFDIAALEIAVFVTTIFPFRIEDQFDVWGLTSFLSYTINTKIERVYCCYLHFVM